MNPSGHSSRQASAMSDSDIMIIVYIVIAFMVGFCLGVIAP